MVAAPTYCDGGELYEGDRPVRGGAEGGGHGGPDSHRAAETATGELLPEEGRDPAAGGELLQDLCRTYRSLYTQPLIPGIQISCLFSFLKRLLLDQILCLTTC